MGEVIVVFRIMPDEPESFEKVKKACESLKPDRLEEEPIAFGLKALKFTKIIPDGPGVMDKLENDINKIKGLGSAENIITSRAL
ncbi:MAG: elongation factor 1-beta [Candidatus Aenigmarchaeota archaeon]|nr:elongation factor 1-beta [Candidatus Aenigmarchaeota archaeon]